MSSSVSTSLSYFNRNITVLLRRKNAIFVSFECNFHVPRSILYRRIRHLNPFRRWKTCINYETCHEYSIFGDPSPLFSIIPFLSPPLLIVPSRSTISFTGRHKNCIKRARTTIDGNVEKGSEGGIALDRGVGSKYRNSVVCFTVCVFRGNIGGFTNVFESERECDPRIRRSRSSKSCYSILSFISVSLQSRHGWRLTDGLQAGAK